MAGDMGEEMRGKDREAGGEARAKAAGMWRRDDVEERWRGERWKQGLREDLSVSELLTFANARRESAKSCARRP